MFLLHRYVRQKSLDEIFHPSDEVGEQIRRRWLNRKISNGLFAYRAPLYDDSKDLEATKRVPMLNPRITSNDRGRSKKKGTQ